jgi:AraC family transcriptional regulator of arabinose operon
MDRRIKTAVLLIHQNPQRPPSKKELCRLVNLSSSRFHELFKAETRKCPAFYVKSRRMGVAKVLLETTFLSVKEVAAKAGFNDLSHFVRDFKKCYGLTPRHYRASLL